MNLPPWLPAGSSLLDCDAHRGGSPFPEGNDGHGYYSFILKWGSLNFLVPLMKVSLRVPRAVTSP